MANTSNKVKFGLKNCHYAIATLAADGTVTFGTPVAMPGAVSLSLDAEGDNDPFYADDSVYYMVSNNNGYSGDFELALIPESFLTDIMHETEDANGVIVENKDVEPEKDPSLHVLLQRNPPFRHRQHQGGLYRGADGDALHHSFSAPFRHCEGKNRYEHYKRCLRRLVQLCI